MTREFVSYMFQRVARSMMTNGKRVRAAVARAKLARAHDRNPVEAFEVRMARLRAASKRARELPDARWCILRTASVQTLALARSLTAAGFEVWAPSYVEARRQSGSKRVVQRDAALMPSFVFARAETQEQVNDLFRAAALPGRAHPKFKIFHQDGRVPVVAERSLKALRLAEEAKAKGEPKGKAEHSIGDAVILQDDAWLGTKGIVLSCNGKRAKVDIGARFPVDVAAWQLVPDDVSGTSSPEGVVAKAA